MVAKWRLEVEIAMGKLPMPISVSSRHFALRYEVPKFLARGGHLCMAMLTIAAVATRARARRQCIVAANQRIKTTRYSSSIG